MLVIAGAFYYDEKDDVILVPHYTGDFCLVDCDRYLTAKDFIEEYDEGVLEAAKDDYVEYDGKFYYRAEYNTYEVDDWMLLSDLSELRFTEEKFDF